MRNLFLILILAFSLSHCTSPDNAKPNQKVVDDYKPEDRDSFAILCQYWNLDNADHPTSHDISFTDNQGIPFQSGIVFMRDSVVLENPRGEMVYGKFSLNDSAIHVNYEDGRKVVYDIIKLNKTDLWLDRTFNKKTSELFYKASDTYWPDPDKNPFSKANYAWVRKPAKPESEAQIRDRARECVRFYQYYFEGYANGGAKTIEFDALPGCFKWYQGAIYIQKEDKLDNKWINCFYSPEEAYKARNMLQEALLKKYDWDTTQTNWVRQTALVLNQIRDSL